MSILKSFWFWFLIITTGIETAVAIFYFEKVQQYAPWTWLAMGGLFCLLLLSSLLIRQQAMVKRMRGAKPVIKESKKEEPWKLKLRADFEQLSKEIERFAQKKFIWVLSQNPLQTTEFLCKAGATPVLNQSDKPYSAELSESFHILVKQGVCYFIPSQNQHSTNPNEPLTPPVLFTLDLLKKFKEKCIDSVLLVQSSTLNEQDSQIIGKQQQAILSTLLRHTSLDIPVYVAYTPTGSGNLFSEITPEVIIGHSCKLNLALPSDSWVQSLFTHMSLELDSKLDSFLLKNHSVHPYSISIFQIRQFLALWKNHASKHIKEVFSHFVGNERPLLRGIYLVPFFDTSRDLSSAFGSESSDHSIWSESKIHAGKSFLSFLESDPASSRFCVRKQQKQTVITLLLSATLFLVSALLLVASIYSTIQTHHLQKVWDKQFQSIHTTPWHSTHQAQDWFRSWDLAWELFDKIENKRPMSIAPGYFSMGNRGSSARSTYERFSRSVYQSTLQNIEKSLQQQLQSSAPTNELHLYNDLRLYLVLSNEYPNQLPQDSVAALLSHAITQELLQKFHHLDEPARASLENHLNRMASMNFTYKVDNDLALQTKQRILDYRNRSGDYDFLIQSGSQLNAFGLDSLGMGDDRLVKQSLAVPGIFTQTAFETVIQKQLSGKAQSSDWVLEMDSETATASATRSINSQELKKRYFADYESQWRQFLDQVNLKMPSDLQAASGVLEMMANPYSDKDSKGLRAFVKHVCQNVDLRKKEKPLDSLSQNAPKKFSKTLNKVNKIANQVNHYLDDESAEELLYRNLSTPCVLDSVISKNRLDAYFNDLTQLAGILRQSNIHDQSTFDFARSLLAGDRKNPLVHAHEEIKLLLESFPLIDRPWISAVFQTPLMDIAQSLIPAVADKVQSNYTETLHQPFQSGFRAAYPFSRHSSREVPLSELVAFFHPTNGNLPQFYKSLEGLYQNESGRITSKNWNGIRIPFKPSSFESLRQWNRLSESLFSTSGQWRGYTVTLSIRTPHNASVEFELDGNRMEVPNGSEKRIQARWPQEGGNGLAIQVKTPNNVFQDNISGEWSLLRLIQKPNASSIPGGKEIVLSFQDKSYIVDIPIRIQFDTKINPGNTPQLFELESAPDIVSR